MDRTVLVFPGEITTNLFQATILYAKAELDPKYIDLH